MTVSKKIISYVEANIIPKYQYFDKAHDISHVEKVIKNSMLIAADYDVDASMVYVIAAYHDVGLSEGRDDHEMRSSKILLEDNNLRKWFSSNELGIMAQAIEDHRASNDYKPRSIYGNIVAEADRDIDYISVLTRIAQYSLGFFPEYTEEQHFDRSYMHLIEKYGDYGYIKLWLDTEQNRKNLEELRKKMTSKEKLKKDFIAILRREGFSANEVIQTIMSRRSVRSYKPEQIDEPLLQTIIEAGRAAPSGGNVQLTHLIVIQDNVVMKDIIKIAKEEFAKMTFDENTYSSLKANIENAQNPDSLFDIFYSAPTLIITAHKIGHKNAIKDSACVLENMMIASTALGLGSCWINQLSWLDDNESMRQYLFKLGLKEDEFVTGSLSLGYPATDPGHPLPRTGNPISYVR